ncbi:ATP-binding protein [Colwellia piezophila]|uniref:ATP-binding protein n=1 Tax=Colwellia piezophila TaxID=211668 RepID=UPI00036B5046|nr:ATP-binding protein [Colwellia piezophila]
MKSFKERVFKYTYNHTWLLLILLFISTGTMIVWYMEKQQSVLVESISIKNAELYLGAVSEFRTLYTSEVVNKLKNSNISIVHDYHERADAIPLPATLSMLLAKRIGQRSSGTKVRLYSPFPFPWRKEDRGLQDSFGQSAWDFFQKSPQLAYFSFEVIGGNRVLRYAVADQMRADCVECHNNHKDTPKSDWKTGDVRGILEVTLPIGNFQQQAKTNLGGFIWLILGVSLVGLFTMMLLIGRLKFNYQQSQKKLNIEIEQGKRAQIKVLESNEDLQQTLIKLRQTQESLVEKETMAALGGMVASIAHEINTPIGICVTAASILEEETQAIISHTEKGKLTRSVLESYTKTSLESGKIITHNLQRACELVESFKQVAVDQTSHERRIFNVNTYLKAIVNSLKPQTKRHVKQVLIDCPETLAIDSFPGALSQVITNLVTNSVKYGFDYITDGTISIKVTVEANSITILYQDDGKGITEELHQKIFEPFYTTGRDTGGSGLGLHIIYNIIVQLFKGTIVCRGGKDEGVIFEIILPFNESLKLETNE